jgi:hypothetical protein
MRRLGQVSGLCLLAVTFFAGSATRAGEDSKIEVRSVKPADLDKTIKGLKGKVVVVDFWAFC